MPLINAIPEAGIRKIRLQQRFRDLPMSDKSSVVKMLTMGRTGEITDSIQFTEDGQEFVDRPEFKEFYEEKTRPDPQPPSQAEQLMPMIRGLMDIIRQQREPDRLEDGELDPQYAHRVGGKEKKTSGGFHEKLATSFSEGGAHGLAATHRELLTDPEYNRFLKGK